MEIPWGFLNSSYVQTLLTFVGAVLVTFIGIGQYYSQQRAGRLQKIYFEDSILALLNQVDSAMITSRQNAYVGVNALDLVSNLINRTYVDHSVLIKNLEALISSLKPPGQFGDVKKEMMPDLFGQKGNILSQWLQKAEVDLDAFYSVIKGSLLLILNSLQETGKRDKKKDEEMLAKIQEHISDNNLRIQRHNMLLFFLSKLVGTVASLDFKNKKDLANMRSNRAIRKVLEKIEESFKMLFAFYKIDNTCYYSYAKDLDGKNFKVMFDGAGNATISREIIDTESLKSPYLIIDDNSLLGKKIGDEKDRPLFDALIGMSNMYVFEEKPELLPTLGSFRASSPAAGDVVQADQIK